MAGLGPVAHRIGYMVGGEYYLPVLVPKAVTKYAGLDLMINTLSIGNFGVFLSFLPHTFHARSVL